MRTRAATSRPLSSSRSRNRWRRSSPFEQARYQRATPLAKGETRERNADLDPQIVWRGVRITLSQAQRKQLQETGEVELGDAQLVWRGKDTQDWSDLVVNPPPIYIQEKVHPKAIIEGYAKTHAPAPRRRQMRPICSATSTVWMIPRLGWSSTSTTSIGRTA